MTSFPDSAATGDSTCPLCGAPVTLWPDGTVPHHVSPQEYLCFGPASQESSSTASSWSQPTASQRHTASAPAPAASQRHTASAPARAAHFPQWIAQAAHSPAAPVVAWGICLIALGALLSAIGVSMGWGQFIDNIGSRAGSDSAAPQVLFFLGGVFSLAGLVCSALGLTRLVAKADVLFAARRS